ncbi:MAG: Holliday junction resolvase RuvX [Anaerolineales bacterium]
MRILAVDHGEKRIGLALSDPTATIASPFKVIEHVSRLLDAAPQSGELLPLKTKSLDRRQGQSFDEEGSRISQADAPRNLSTRCASRLKSLLSCSTNPSARKTRARRSSRWESHARNARGITIRWRRW